MYPNAKTSSKTFRATSQYCVDLLEAIIAYENSEIELKPIGISNLSKTEKIILGIDPGTTIMGFGLIKVVHKQMQFLQLNELKLSKYDDHYVRLRHIFERTIELIETFHPDEIAIEAPFFGKNVQSMLKLGRAQGVAMAAGLSRQIPITEYSPKKIKMAITGNGNASKEQVAKMLQSTLGLKELPKNLDSTDGLAAAVCHFYNEGRIEVGKSYSGWDAFVKQNEKRIDK
jgi:crossover junction endodeoxyribonuclease RuvC